MRKISYKAEQFTESVIREMTRLAAQHEAINLAQGFPNFSAPDFIKEAACRAIREDINQYEVTWGSVALREAIARNYRRFYDFQVDPELEVTVCCGATECMIASLLAVLDPGEHVIVFEPFYENYGPDAIIAGATPHFVTLDPENNFAFSREELRELCESLVCKGGVRALILNSPNNPSGKVFSTEELQWLAELAEEFDFYLITDEIYEHIIYEGLHVPIATIGDARARTITISGLSKTFSVTGWRLGYIVAPPEVTSAIRKMHDFLTVGAPAPLQAAAAVALDAPLEYYRGLSEEYRTRRDVMLNILCKVGFRAWEPKGAYYIMADISPLTQKTDVEFVKDMIRQVGVATVPGSSFFHRPERGGNLIRFAFCKTVALLEKASQRLEKL
jgi:aminotransferase